MTRKAERAFLGRIRSAEYQRKRKRDTFTLLAVVMLYAGVPTLWYGAIEFGLVHPIQTPEFKRAIDAMGLFALIVLVTFANRWFDYRSDDRKLREITETREGEGDLAEAEV